MKKMSSISILLLFTISIFSQYKGWTHYAFGDKNKKIKTSDYSYTSIEIDDMLGDKKTEGKKWGSTINNAVFEFSNILTNKINDKKEQAKIEFAKEQSLAKLEIIKSQYSEYTTYPLLISDGWHNVIATDNSNFCKDAKVLVKANRVVKFVIDNYIPMDFVTTRNIKNAKNVITISDFNGQNLSIFELYFIYDIDEQVIVSPPEEPGFICFWSDMNDFDEIKLILDGKKMEKLTLRFNEEPDCFSKGMICRVLKSGLYTFEAFGYGRISWKGTIEIKKGMCLKYRLGK